MYKRYFKGCDGKTCPSEIFLEKMRGGCFQTRFELISGLSMACGIGVLACPSSWSTPGVAVGSGVALDWQRGLEWQVVEQLDLLATACRQAGPPAHTELPSSWGTRVPCLQLDLSHASGEDTLERMATYSW